MTDTSRGSKADPPNITAEGIFFALVGMYGLLGGKGGWVEGLAWGAGMAAFLTGMRIRPGWGRTMQLVAAVMLFWTVRLATAWR
jgi:hypothetical protein